MLFIAHRINTIKELVNIPTNFGVEIDIRDWNKDLILQHDPFKEGELFEEWLKHYNHSLIILNIKSEGIEFKVLEYLKKYNILNYFFLDCSVPMINKLINLGEKNIAIRYSEYEPEEFIYKFKGKCKWLWIDCFTYYPNLSYNILNDFNCCIVSPKLQNREILTKYAGINELIIDKIYSVCDKIYNVNYWLKE